jgi:tetratricopeptide (TPR) repeat protein
MSSARTALLASAIAAALITAVTPAQAQNNRRSYIEKRADQSMTRDGDKIEEVAVLYPEATREEPRQRASGRFQRQINAMIVAQNEGEAEKAIELANELIANERTSPYDKAAAYQIAGIASAELDDVEGAIRFTQQAIDANVLENNAHFSAMRNLAAFQADADRLPEATATLERLVNETRSTRPELLLSLANAYFQIEQFDKAIPLLQQVTAGEGEPNVDALKLLLGSYALAEKPAEAIAVGQRLLAIDPNDKRLVFSVAQMHSELGQDDQATALYEGLRSKGLFTEPRDYQILYTHYYNLDGRERNVIAVVEDGLQKGVLKRDLSTLGVLAQAAYFSENMPLAIATYREAAALDPKGETGLNYAKVLSAEAMDAEARDAAKAALAKGVAKPGEAWMVIARSQNALDNNAAYRAALQEASKHPETREQATRVLSQLR